MINTWFVSVKACGPSNIMVTYKGEVVGMYPRSTPLKDIGDRLRKMHKKGCISDLYSV